MSLRSIAALAAFGLVAIAPAADKKKLDYAPETGPEPRTVVPPDATLTAQLLLQPPPLYVPAEPICPSRNPSRNEPPCPACPATRTAERHVMKTYAVADLVILPPPTGAVPTGTPKTAETDLIKKLTAAVEPTSWSGLGGQCTIEYFPVGMALVVNATPTVHRAVEKYLDDLRQIQDTQFTVKLVVATVSDAALERMGLARDFGVCACKPGEVRTRAKFLSSDDVQALGLRKEDCVQLTAPTLAVLNGQKGSVKCGQIEHFLTGVTVQVVDGQIVYTPKNEPHELGVTVEVVPTLSADRKFIKLAVSGRSRDLAVRPVGTIPLSTPGRVAELDGRQGDLGAFTKCLQDPRIVTRTVDETVTLPDGGTVVFYGGPAACEETVRETAPMFADVPFLQELMVRDKKVTSTNHLLVFATPRVAKEAGCDECVQCAGGNARLGKLLAEYGRACREANTEEARRLALECLVIDPTCFGSK